MSGRPHKNRGGRGGDSMRGRGRDRGRGSYRGQSPGQGSMRENDNLTGTPQQNPRPPIPTFNQPVQASTPPQSSVPSPSTTSTQTPPAHLGAWSKKLVIGSGPSPARGGPPHTPSSSSSKETTKPKPTPPSVLHHTQSSAPGTPQIPGGFPHTPSPAPYGASSGRSAHFGGSQSSGQLSIRRDSTPRASSAYDFSSTDTGSPHASIRGSKRRIRGRFDGNCSSRESGEFDKGKRKSSIYQSDEDNKTPRSTVVDQNITDIENEIISNSRSCQSEREGVFMPHRPGHCTHGDDVVLWTNHLHMTISKPERNLYRYTMTISRQNANTTSTATVNPNTDTASGQQVASKVAPTGSARSNQLKGKKLKRVIKLFMEEYLHEYQDCIVTDYVQNLVCTVDLIEKLTTYSILYTEEPGLTGPSVPLRYNVVLVAADALSLKDFLQCLQEPGHRTPPPNMLSTSETLNMIAGYFPKLRPGTFTVGLNRYYRPQGINDNIHSMTDLGGGLVALRGFAISTRPATSRTLLNVQIKHSTFYRAGSLDELINSFGKTYGPNTYALEKFLKGLTVRTTSGSDNYQKRITGLATEQDGHEPNWPEVSCHGAGSDDVKFHYTPPTSHGGATPHSRYITVTKYFSQVHGMQVVKKHLPVVNVGSEENPCYVPPEFCEVPPGQSFPIPKSTLRLDAQQTDKMLRYAVKPTYKNAQLIETEGCDLLGFAPSITNKTLTAFDISVDPRLITVPARRLDCPEVAYARKKTLLPKNATWNMSSCQFSEAPLLEHWTVLHIYSDGSHCNKERTDQRTNHFATCLKKLGLVANAPFYSSLLRSPNASNLQTIDKEIENHSKEARRTKRSRQLLLVILSSQDKAIYNRVKYICDVELGILCVCVQESKFMRTDPNFEVNYFANVALKINLKLGGRNQALPPKELGIIADGTTMLVGIDVTHPSPGSGANAPSVASVVASIDSKLAQWPASIRINEARKEMVTDLEAMFMECLTRWRKNNPAYPDKIIVYRDGVSEGQYTQVTKRELPLLVQACQKLYPKAGVGPPKFSVIVVGKRHNVRFYESKLLPSGLKMTINPQNGTVVDRGVTEARNWDFYLQAHTALKGTARPAHYYVVYDEIFRFKPIPNGHQHPGDTLIELTHNVCYLFGRATKAVSVCPPAYYADLVCERARCYLEEDFAPLAAGNNPGQVLVALTQRERIIIHRNVADKMFYI